MSIVSQQQLDDTKFYTSSTISIYQGAELQNAQVSFVWRRVNSEGMGNEIVGTNQQYLCSALDQNQYIEVLIESLDGNVVKRIMGPIVLQEKLCQVSLPNVFRVRTILNKNIPYMAQLSFHPSLSEMFELKVQDEIMVFLSEFIRKDRWKCLEPSSTEPEALFINIKPIKKDLLCFINKLHIPVHLGHNLKFIFQNRFNKDLFLMRVMQWQPSEEKPTSVPNLLLTETSCKMYSKPTLSSLTREHEADKTELTKQQQQDDGCLDIKIMQDIYQILYTSTRNNLIEQNINNPENINKTRVDNTSAGSSKHCPDTNKVVQKRRNSANENKSFFIQESFGYASTKKDPIQAESIIYGTFTSPQVGLSPRRFPNISNQHIDHVHSQLVRVILNDPQKVYQLLHINKKLAEENERLRSENTILREDNFRLKKRERSLTPRKGSYNFPYSSASQVDGGQDIYSLKQMMEQIAKRVIRLQEKQEQKPKNLLAKNAGLTEKNNSQKELIINTDNTISQERMTNFLKRQKFNHVTQLPGPGAMGSSNPHYPSIRQHCYSPQHNNFNKSYKAHYRDIPPKMERTQIYRKPQYEGIKTQPDPPHNKRPAFLDNRINALGQHPKKTHKSSLNK